MTLLAALPLITDPFFYAVAIPAVLLLGISKSGFGAGFGSLAVPMMAVVVTVPQAAAILMPVLLLMDLLGISAFRKHFDKKLLKFLLPFALLGTLVGTLLFKVLNPQTVAGIVGVFTLLFLAQRLLFPPKPDSAPPPRWLGAILTAAAGFTSFIAHAGGPPLNAYLIPLKLKPLVFAATVSYLFFFINLSKWIPYAWLGLLDMRNFATSLVLLPLAPMGVWLGVRIAKRINPDLFYKLLYTGMFLTGCKLVWDGFK
jgi:uncharacterized membrane protein YfcA